MKIKGKKGVPVSLEAYFNRNTCVLASQQAIKGMVWIFTGIISPYCLKNDTYLKIIYKPDILTI